MGGEMLFINQTNKWKENKEKTSDQKPDENKKVAEVEEMKQVRFPGRREPPLKKG
jgi:hypothetical protein